MHDAVGTAGLDTDVVERARREVAARRAERAVRRSAFATTLNRWICSHWLMFLNTGNALFVAGTAFAPWLRAQGHDSLAAAVYDFYRLQCPQRPTHSFFLFGYKMGMEERMVVIYADWLVAGLVFAVLRRRLLPPHAVLPILLSLPMLLDVASQMVGLRDGTWPWRVATGTLFAAASAWWALPRVQIGLSLRAGRRV